MLLGNPFTHDFRPLKQGRSLVAAGADVRVVATAAPGLPERDSVDGVRVVRASHDPLPARLIRGLVARRRGAGADEPVVLAPRAAPAGGLAARVHAAELAARRVLTAITYLHWYRHAIRAALHEPVDVVVAHDFETLPPAWAIARRAGAGLLYDAHELVTDQPQIVPRTRLGVRRVLAVERRLARRAAAVTTVGDALADELARRHGIRRPVVVRNAPYARASVPPRDRGWLVELGVPEDARVAIYTGGLVPERGIEDLVAAAARVDGLHVVLMGPGQPADLAELTAAAQRAGLDGRFHLAPAVRSDDVPAHAAAADVGVIPFRPLYLNHWLSLPNKLFEYLAAGLPIVTVAFPELERIVTAYGAGRTCPPEDPAALAAAIRAVLDDPAELERLRAGAARAAAELTWEREEPAYLAAVAAALARSAGWRRRTAAIS